MLPGKNVFFAIIAIPAVLYICNDYYKAKVTQVRVQMFAEGLDRLADSMSSRPRQPVTAPVEVEPTAPVVEPETEAVDDTYTNNNITGTKLNSEFQEGDTTDRVILTLPSTGQVVKVGIVNKGRKGSEFWMINDQTKTEFYMVPNAQDKAIKLN